MSNNRDLPIFIATLISATFLMGASFVAGKVLILGGIPALSLVAWRFFAAALIIFPFALAKNDWQLAAFLPSHLGGLGYLSIFLIGAFQTAGALGIMFLSMKTISAANAAILLFTNPLWVAILGVVFLHEKLKPMRLLGLLIGILGVYFAIGANLSVFAVSSGQALGLIAAFCWAIATTINKKAAPKIETFALSFWQMLIGSIILLAFAFLQDEKVPRPDMAQVAWFLFLAGPGSALSFSLWFVALRKGGATNASSYLFLAPLFAVICSYFILHTKLNMAQSIGGLLICFAIWLINHNPESKYKKSTIIEAESEGAP